MSEPTEKVEKYRDPVKPAERVNPEQAEREDQEHVMSEDEKVDEYIDGSFPASDPPGYRSKSTEDKNLH